MTEILGLPLPQALGVLKARGAHDVRVIESQAPRGARNAGTLRVTCVRDEGRTLIVSRFFDTADGGKDICRMT